MAFKPIGNGYLNITAGTPVRITANRTTPGARLAVQALFIQQLQANTGKLYLMSISNEVSQAQLSKTTGIGVVAIIPAPTLVAGVATVLPWISVTIPFSPGGFNAADYFLDTDINNDDALVSAIVI